MSKIGYQDGIDAFEEWFRKLSGTIKKHNEWVVKFTEWSNLSPELRAIEKPPVPPKLPTIPLEGPNFSQGDMSTWPWPLKFYENTMRKLKDDHDAAIPSNGGGNGGEDPPPPDPTFGVAPRTYNYAVENNSDPLFCKNSPGVIVNGDGSFRDKFSRYDTNGKDIDGGRDRTFMVPGLRKSNNVDGRDPCELYDGLTKWPAESYLR